MEIEDCALIVLLNGGEMEGPTSTDICGETVRDLPVVLNEVFLYVVAGADLVFLEVDLEGIYLAEEKAGD